MHGAETPPEAAGDAGLGEDAIALTRRLELANLNAWPSAITLWDGAWCLRMMPGSGSRRVNSVTVFDPADAADLEARLDRMLGHFQRRAVRPVFRWTPLFPEGLVSSLRRRGWTRISETLVMVRVPGTAPPAPDPVAASSYSVHTVEPCPWLDDVVAIGAAEPHTRPVLESTLAMIGPPVTTWLITGSDGVPVASMLAVSDGPLVGLFMIHVAPEHRRRGHAERLVALASTLGQTDGPPTVWLQVEADNAAGVALYTKAGFRAAYRYAYWVNDEGTGNS